MSNRYYATHFQRARQRMMRRDFPEDMIGEVHSFVNYQPLSKQELGRLFLNLQDNEDSLDESVLLAPTQRRLNDNILSRWYSKYTNLFGRTSMEQLRTKEQRLAFAKNFVEMEEDLTPFGELEQLYQN